MSFESQITQLDSSQLDSLFTDIPNSTPNADTLIVGKDDVKVVKQDTQIPFIDNLDDLDKDDTTDDTDDKSKTDDVNDKVDDKKVDDKDDKGSEDDDKGNDENNESVKEVLKNTVEYLINSGQWVDFEGRENLEITQEVYADLVAKQDEHRVSQMFSELLDSTGEYGKAIISHIKTGGNPDEIIDLFKEQKQIEQMDSSTEKGKQSIIEKYYSEVLGWKPEKVEKTIKRLVEDNDIESEYKDVKELYDSHYESKLEELQEEAKNAERLARQKQEAFVSNIREALNEDSTLTSKDKALIASSILDFRHQLDNGQKVNDFYIKFAEMQADPKKYIKLVRYVMNPEGFENTIKKKEESNAAAKAFSFIKGNAALNKNKNVSIDINDNPSKKTKGTDFSFAIKK